MSVRDERTSAILERFRRTGSVTMLSAEDVGLLIDEIERLEIAERAMAGAVRAACRMRDVYAAALKRIHDQARDDVLGEQLLARIAVRALKGES